MYVESYYVLSVFCYSVPARITHHPPTVTEITGPNALLPITIRSDYPGTVTVTWYRDGQLVMEESITVTAATALTGHSSLMVSHRNESGTYRVKVGESRLRQGLGNLPQGVVDMATHTVTFNVHIKG